MDRVKFVTACAAGVIVILGFFYIVAGCATELEQSDNQRQKDCVSAGQSYIYNPGTGHYDCRSSYPNK